MINIKNKKGEVLHSVESLICVNLSGMNLDGANFKKANLRAINLSGCSLVKADFTGCNLSQADIRNCNFDGANISKVNFSGAKYSGTSFRYIDVSGSTDLVITFSDWVVSISADYISIGWHSFDPKGWDSLNPAKSDPHILAFWNKHRIMFIQIHERMKEFYPQVKKQDGPYYDNHGGLVKNWPKRLVLMSAAIVLVIASCTAIYNHF